MKRFLIRMSALATIVVLGLIAIAQAQKGIGRSSAEPPASQATAETNLPGLQPTLQPTITETPRELPNDLPMNPLRANHRQPRSPLIRTSAFASDETAVAAPAVGDQVAGQAPAMPEASVNPPGLRPVPAPLAGGGEPMNAAAMPEMSFPSAGQSSPSGLAANNSTPAPAPAGQDFGQDMSLQPPSGAPAAMPLPNGAADPSALAPQVPLAVEVAPAETQSMSSPRPMPTEGLAGTAQPLALPVGQEPAIGIDPSMSTAIPSGNPLPAAGGAGIPGVAQLEGPQTPQITLQKSGPQEIQVGKAAKFQVKVQNTGQVAAQNVEIRDDVPRGTQLISTTPPASRGVRGELVWPLGTLKPGEEMSVEIELMPIAEGEIGSVATVAFHAEASARSIATKPELVVETVGPRQVLIGEEVVLSITVANPGSGIASEVVIDERVPAGLQHAAGAELEYEIGELQPNESRQLELRMIATQAGRITNTLTARGAANLRAEHQWEIDVLAPQLQVAIDGPKRRYLEREAVYSVSVSNPGTAPARQVELVAHLPTGMKFAGANNAGYFDEANQSVHWVLEELPANETGSVQLTAIPTVAGEQTIRVSGRADRGLADEQQQAILVEGIAAILFEVVDVDDPIEVNGETTYEIRVVNQGSKAATNVQVIAELPPGMRALAAEGPTANGVRGNQVSFEPLAKLAPKADTTYRVRVQGIQAGDQRIRVQLQTAELQPPVTKEESTRVYADQ